MRRKEERDFFLNTVVSSGPQSGARVGLGGLRLGQEEGAPWMTHSVSAVHHTIMCACVHVTRGLKKFRWNAENVSQN